MDHCGCLPEELLLVVFGAVWRWDPLPCSFASILFGFYFWRVVFLCVILLPWMNSVVVFHLNTVNNLQGPVAIRGAMSLRGQWPSLGCPVCEVCLISPLCGCGQQGLSSGCLLLVTLLRCHRPILCVCSLASLLENNPFLCEAKEVALWTLVVFNSYAKVSKVVETITVLHMSWHRYFN